MQETFARKANTPPVGDMCGPILLFGMPRSGTTWLGKIFDSHPDTLYRHEPDSFGRLNFMPLAPQPSDAEAVAPNLRSFVAGLRKVRDTKIVATLPDFPKSYLSRFQFRWNRLAVRAAKAQTRWTRREAQARVWLPAGGDSAHVVWKSIESPARLGTIGTALPQSRGVFIVRHPCGYVASVIRGTNQGRFTDPDELGEDLGVLEALVETETGRELGVTLQQLRESSPVVRVAWQWALTNDKVLTETGGTEQFLPLRYEDLCADPVGVTHRLFEWCGLAWDEQTERFLDASTHTHQDRYYSVFKDPARVANAWRKELPENLQQEVMEAIGGTRAGRMYGMS